MYDIKNTDFKFLLMKYRKSRGLTLENLGNLIGKTKATISKYENGEIIPDVLTILEICNALGISLSQLFPIKNNNYNSKHFNPFNTNKLYLYYYTEDVFISSVLEIQENNELVSVKFFNGVKNLNLYADEYSYYYEGILECDQTLGYINLRNSNSENTRLEKVQISFNIPWSKNFEMTNCFILGITPNSIPTIKKGLISTFPINPNSNFNDNLIISTEELIKIQENNSWILENKNYDHFFYSS